MESVRGSPIVISPQPENQIWVKAVAVIAIIAALVFAFLWCTNSAGIDGNNNSNNTQKPMKRANKPEKRRAPPQQMDEEDSSEDDLEIDPDLRAPARMPRGELPYRQARGSAPPPFTAPGGMMPGMARDMPPMGGSGPPPPDGMGGPPPPIKVGRDPVPGGGDGGFGGGGGGETPYRAYAGGRRGGKTRGVSIKL